MRCSWNLLHEPLAATSLHYLSIILDPVYTKPPKFGNCGFILKTHQMFSIAATLDTKRQRNLKKLQSPVIWMCVWSKPAQGNRIVTWASLSKKSSVFKMFSVHTKTLSRRLQIPLACRTGVIFCVFLENRSESQANAKRESPAWGGLAFRTRLALASLRPKYAKNYACYLASYGLVWKVGSTCVFRFFPASSDGAIFLP